MLAIAQGGGGGAKGSCLRNTWMFPKVFSNLMTCVLKSKLIQLLYILTLKSGSFDYVSGMAVWQHGYLTNLVFNQMNLSLKVFGVKTL